MIPYILHVTVITTICFLFYKLLLQKETFYRWNRWMLMGCLASAFLLPLLPAPRIGGLWAGQDKSASQKVVAAARPVGVDAQQPVIASQPHEGKEVASQPVAADHPRVVDHASVQPVTEHLPVTDHAPVVEHSSETDHAPLMEHLPVTDHPQVAERSPVAKLSPVTDHASASWGAGAAVMAATVVRWLFYAYVFGVLIFGFNFILQLGILLFQSYSGPVIRDGRYRIVETSGNRAPCSFGNTIFINPASYDWETYNQILIHEKTHVSGWHTIDILLAEVAVVCQWFNPVAWMYRREVENNLEFLTDAAVLQHEDVQQLAYQLSLLRVSAPHLPFSITNNYNQSLLKRRIVMMNSKRSSGRTIWKYFFLLPMFTALVLLLNKPAVYSQTQGGAKNKKASAGKAADKARVAGPAAPAAPADVTGAASTVRSADTARPSDVSGSVGASAGSGSSSGHPDTDAGDLNWDFSWDFHVPAAVRLDAAVPVAAVDPIISVAPVISVAPAHTLSAGPRPALGPSPAVGPVPTMALQPLTYVQPDITVSDMAINVRGPMDTLREGSWFVTTSDNKLWFELKAEDEDHSWSSSLKVEKSEINPFPGVGNVSFTLVRDAGTMSFTGQFDGQQGFGHFHFQPADGYFNALQQMGVEDTEDRRQLSFFMANVKKEYADMVVHNGYPHISGRMLISFSAMHIDKEFIQYWHSSGLQDMDEPRTLITLKAQNIDKAYVEEMKAAGYDHLSARELSSMKAMHITGAYVRAMGRGSDNQMIPVRELVSYKAMNIDSNYVGSLRKLGLSNLERRDIASLYNMHVTPEYIKSLQDMGFSDLSVREIVQLKSQDVNAEFVKSFRDAGLADLSARELVQLKVTRVTPEFIKGFRDLGYKDISSSRLSMLKATGVTPEFVSEFRKIGFDDIPLSVLPSLKSMGVNAEYVSKMRDKGFVSKDLNKYIRLKNDFN